MTHETQKEREAKENGRDRYEHIWEGFDVLEQATETVSRKRMAYWIDWACRTSEESCSRFRDLVDIYETSHIKQEDIDELATHLAVYRRDLAIRMGSMAFLGAIEGKGLSKHLPEILEGLNNSCNKDPYQRFSDYSEIKIFDGTKSRFVGMEYLGWALEYVNRWERYHKMNWETPPIKREQLFK